MTNIDRADHRLPGGWRLADHPEHGRVLVVRTFGNKAIYATPAEMLGIRTHVALLSDLTFADAARQAQEDIDARWNLPSHRTEAGYPNCSTCDGGGCPDCTDPA